MGPNPAAQNEPAGQITSLVEEPAGHDFLAAHSPDSRSVDEPARQNPPAEHTMGPNPAAQNEPGVHARSPFDEPAGHNFPAGHGMRLPLSPPGQLDPGGQDEIVHVVPPELWQ